MLKILTTNFQLYYTDLEITTHQPNIQPNSIKNDTLQALHVPAGTNAHHAPALNVLGMAVGVKLQHAQTGGQFSCVECSLQPRQMGPPPHVHHALDEIMYVIQGTVSVLEGDRVVEVAAGGWHFRPRGIVHTFWNGTDAPAAFLDLYPSAQDLPITWRSWPPSARPSTRRAPIRLLPKAWPASKPWMPATTTKFSTSRCRPTWPNMAPKLPEP